MKSIIVLIFGISLCPSLLIGEERASDVILRYSERVKSVIKKGIPIEKKKLEIRKIVDEILDYSELAKRSLGRHYKDRSKEEIEKFSSLMKELIETSYMKKITSTIDYKLVVKSEDDLEGELIVNTEISSQDGKVQVGFALLKRDDKWVIYDMIIDEVSTLKNYKSEFNRIIKEQGFDMVLKKMENKLSELKNEK
ncbi:MAG: ABC transporter substrate-binding protein [Deltaproteobacteria bacterium]|nr:ABC transporter substrate-binding protein [Deltaproteobacteria bacterium]